MNQKKLLVLGLFIPLVAIAYSSYKYAKVKDCESTKTGYEVVETEVYFNARIDRDGDCSVIRINLQEADPETFLDLGFQLAKDKNNVYDASFKGYSRIGDVDVSSYFVFNRSYRKDVNNVYWYEEVIPNADPNSFVVLSEEYAKDSSHAYYLGAVMEGTDPENFDIP